MLLATGGERSLSRGCAERRTAQGPCSISRRGPVRGRRESCESGRRRFEDGRVSTTPCAIDDGGGGVMHGFETIGAISTAAVTLNRFGFFARMGMDKRYRKEQVKWPKLLASVAIDAVGVSSYALPLVGESEDIVWAPISAALVQLIYGNYFLTALDLVEEGLPFSDIIPTATVAWALEYTQVRRLIPFLPKGKDEDEDEDKDKKKKKA